MSEDVETRVSARVNGFEVERQIHAVPPHEVYAVRVDGRRAVLKRDTGPTATAGIEGRVMEFVSRRTDLPVPEVLLKGDDFFIAAWDPAAPRPDDEANADERWSRAAGRGIATLHAQTAPHIQDYGVLGLEDGELAWDDHPRWADAVQDYLRRRRRALDAYGHADIADAVIDFLKAGRDRFDAPGEAVCCHGWATPEHVAVEGGEVVAVIDFEHAIAAPGEFDVWRTLTPLYGPSADGPGATAFLAGYESIRQLPAGFTRRKPLYRLLNGVYYLESLYVQDQHSPAETAERADRFRTGLRELLAELRDPGPS